MQQPIIGRLAQRSLGPHQRWAVDSSLKRRKQFRVLIRPAAGRRISQTVKSEADAIALVRHFNRLGSRASPHAGAR